jgi:hypothetical protein
VILLLIYSLTTNSLLVIGTGGFAAAMKWFCTTGLQILKLKSLVMGGRPPNAYTASSSSSSDFASMPILVAKDTALLTANHHALNA